MMEMIDATELAKEVIAQALRNANVGQQRGLRLTRGNGLFLELDEATDQDRVIRHDCKVVLIISKDVEHELGPGLIDIQETSSGNDLVLRRKADSHNPPGWGAMHRLGKN
ncbi:MAG: hypothetical protein R6U37_02210 [Dehalococcoidia bacterium]